MTKLRLIFTPPRSYRGNFHKLHLPTFRNFETQTNELKQISLNFMYRVYAAVASKLAKENDGTFWFILSRDKPAGAVNHEQPETARIPGTAGSRLRINVSALLAQMAHFSSSSLGRRKIFFYSYIVTVLLSTKEAESDSELSGNITSQSYFVTEV